MRRTLLWLMVPLAVGVAIAVVTIGRRGAGAAFSYAQRHSSALTAKEVERLVSTAPAPVHQVRPGAHASCAPHGGGELRNPWHCSLRYASGLQVSYRVTVRGDGSYLGVNLADKSTIGGCCTQIG